MDQFNLVTKVILALWPLLVAMLACFYRLKQNGLNPWTGGPISWPKAFWLSYTIQTWFFLPFLFLVQPTVPSFLKIIVSFHLLSWWIRGILEMVMIYKWFNWSPRYGISHDIFHLIGCGLLFFNFRQELSTLVFGTAAFLVALYLFMLFISTTAEISFAFLFLRLRTIQEKNENVYFASDDPKWIFVNRYTLSVVMVVYSHLFFQSYYALKHF
ncbi:MAG: hypothetical protein ACXVCE_04315 [Bacteriovorax sp.]